MDRSTNRSGSFPYCWGSNEIPMKVSVCLESPVRQERLWAVRVQRALLQIVLQHLSVSLVYPGMSTVLRPSPVTYGQVRLDRLHGGDGCPQPCLIQKEPDIFIPRKCTER